MLCIDKSKSGLDQGSQCLTSGFGKDRVVGRAWLAAGADGIVEGDCMLLLLLLVYVAVTDRLLSTRALLLSM